MVAVLLAGDHEPCAEVQRDERTDDRPPGLGRQHLGDTLAVERRSERWADECQQAGIAQHAGDVGMVVHQREAVEQAAAGLAGAGQSPHASSADR